MLTIQICCLTRITIVLTATYQTDVGEGMWNTQIKTHQADYSWFPADFKLSSSDTLCDPPDTNEREHCRHREKLHDSYTPNSFSFHALLPRKKDDRNMEKKTHDRLSILRSKGGSCVSI